MKKDLQKGLIRRLKLVEGQVRGLQRMIDEDKYCIDVITQISATREALSSLEDIMLEKHLSTCAVEQMKGREQGRAVREILRVYKLSKKL